ncbi:MAG: hypothetical protein J6K95_02085 [Rikenellaceae bacterium]|nr:hypothetical protein [Rikenellaceae bacterium]
MIFTAASGKIFSARLYILLMLSVPVLLTIGCEAIDIANLGTKSSYDGDAQSNDIARAGKVMDELEKSIRR